MSFIVTQINIDDSSDKTITGTYAFDRAAGGTFIGGSGVSFPGTPAAGEWFWRTDTNILYRRNDANSAWDAVTVAVTDATNILAFGGGGIATTTTTRYLTPGYTTGNAPTSAVPLVIPRSGVLRNLYVRHNNTGTGAANITYTVRVNGVATSLSVVMLPTAVLGSDIVNTVSVNAGDYVDLQVSKAASISNSPDDIMATFEVAA